MISEPMLVYYLKFFRDFFWPDGVLAPPNPITTDEERKQIRLEAKSALTRNIPGAIPVIIHSLQLNTMAVTINQYIYSLR